jgi:hypothetical protein
MKIVEEVKKALYAKYQTSTLWTVDAIPFYMDHAPQSKNYPIICVYYISSGNFMAMPSTIQPGGFDYIDSRFQFSVYGNDRQNVQLTDIQDRLEDVFHRQPLTLGSNCTCIAVISLNQRTQFYDQKNKIYTISNDMRILAGR